MDGKKKEPRKRRSSQGNALMAVVCVYIIYLGIKILSDYAKGGVKGTPGWSQILFGILFIAIGGLFLSNYVRLYLRARKEEKDPAEEEQDVAKDQQVTEAEEQTETPKRIESDDQTGNPEQTEDQNQE
jgi:cytochrome c biogenesis protein CcdA